MVLVREQHLLRTDHRLGPEQQNGIAPHQGATRQPLVRQGIGRQPLEIETLRPAAPAHRHAPGPRLRPPRFEQSRQPRRLALQLRLPVVAQRQRNTRRRQRHDADDHQQFEHGESARTACHGLTQH